MQDFEKLGAFYVGKRYDNDYCFVFRMQDGKIVEVREYMDTILADAALGRA